MKKNYTFLLLLLSFVVIAQAPANYYNNATGTGYALKTQLSTIITNGHIDKGYGSGTSQSNNGLWSAFKTTDRDMDIGYENDNTIIDIYSENPTSTDPYNFNYNNASGANAGQCGNYSIEGDCYNREHLIPQSYFDNVSTLFMKSDVQHIYPTDGKVNNKRNNYAFGKVGVASFTSQNGSKLGTALNSGYSAGFSGIVFEPIDEFKGDIARVYFYFATRYQSQMASFYATGSASEVSDMFNGTANQVFSPTFLNILLTWNAQDPVSTKEIKRNNACYAHQGNRNPFIDNNSYVAAIWGAPLSTETFEALASVVVYPNPSNNQRINIQSKTVLDEIQLINVNGQIMQQIKNPAVNDNSYSVENIPAGFYFLRLTNGGQSVVKKIIVN
jgi:endonuclease I